uniref:WD repeat-containing protein 37 n=1 Tax=Timema shepardi TaxID=629360 RepID=A0A7R9ALK3_TIMSH|nr:unnamed protein product [Timema shepardi]
MEASLASIQASELSDQALGNETNEDFDWGNFMDPSISELANALVVLSSTAEDGEIEVRILVGDMPHDIQNNASKPPKSKRINIPRVHSNIENEIQNFQSAGFRPDIEGDSILPSALRSRLQDLFGQIEKEFETLYTENLNLQEKVDTLNERLERESYIGDKQSYDLTDFDNASSKAFSKPKSVSSSSQKVKTAHKLKAQTSKIVSSFKGPTVSCSLVREFTGHKDGIWEVNVARPGQPIIGTASADHTACIWSIETGRCLLQYQGHTGSVNSIRFHPSRDLVLTSSGDQAAHIWQAAVNWDLPKAHSSEEELDTCEKSEDMEVCEGTPNLRTPLCELVGHNGVVMAADWLPGGDQVITASWDRTANLFDAETGELMHSLSEVVSLTILATVDSLQQQTITTQHIAALSNVGLKRPEVYLPTPEPSRAHIK